MQSDTSPPLRIAAAQSTSVAGDITANMLIHTRFINAAHQAGVALLVFPELSLCGYELPLCVMSCCSPMTRAWPRFGHWCSKPV